MIKKTTLSVLPFLFILIVVSCNQDVKNTTDESVSPDLVTNPITADGKNSKSKLPEMSFKKTTHDFGAIVQGEKVTHKFIFTNTGGADLIISDVKATCGCTDPTYPKIPIKPGKSDEVEVVFNSAGFTGSQQKSIRILTNAQPNTIKLNIEAEIIVIND